MQQGQQNIMAERKKTLISKPKTAAGTKLTPPKSPQPAIAAHKPSSPAKPVPDAAPRSAVIRDALKKKDLIDKVTAATGAKKTTVREIVEATLGVLGDALSKGSMLNLPPFGKAKVSRAADAASGKAMTVKLRRGGPRAKPNAKPNQSLADAED